MDIECEAEGKVSAAEFSHLENNSRNAFENMMLFARGVILARPSTHRGLIHQARYLAAQFNDPIASASGCTYLPDKIGEQPWPQTYLPQPRGRAPQDGRRARRRTREGGALKSQWQRRKRARGFGPPPLVGTR